MRKTLVRGAIHEGYLHSGEIYQVQTFCEQVGFIRCKNASSTLFDAKNFEFFKIYDKGAWSKFFTIFCGRPLWKVPKYILCMVACSTKLILSPPLSKLKKRNESLFLLF